MASNRSKDSSAGRAAVPNKPLAHDTWSVNFSDDETRELTTAEIVAGFKKGTVTSDAYVWKDGMSDWAPVLDVPELQRQLGPIARRSGTSGSGVVTNAIARPSQAKMKELFGGLDLDDDPKAAAGSKAAAPQAPRTAQLPVSRAPAPPPTRAPSPPGTRSAAPPPAKTGGSQARADDSVLFSLDALKAGLDTPEEQPKAPSADLFGLGGGSGLGSLGGGGLGGLSGPLGTQANELLTAPVQEPPKPLVRSTSVRAPRKKQGLALLLGVGAFLVLGGGAWALLGSGDDEAESKVEAEPDREAADAEKQRLAEQLAQAEEEKKRMAEQLAQAEEEKKRAAEEDAKKSEAAKVAEDAKQAELAKQEATKSPTTAKSTEVKKTATSSAATKATTEKAAATPQGGFSKDAARTALSTAAARASSCKKAGGPTGPGKAVVTFSPSGKVTSAIVQGGAYGGTPVGGCIAGIFRQAKVPAFSGSTVTVTKSFRL